MTNEIANERRDSMKTGKTTCCLTNIFTNSKCPNSSKPIISIPSGNVKNIFLQRDHRVSYTGSKTMKKVNIVLHKTVSKRSEDS